MAREARDHVGATTPACGGPHETGAWEEASASASAHPAHARQHARAPGALRRSQRRGLSGCSPGVPSLEAPSRGVLSDPAAASRNGNAVRSLIGTAIGEQRSIFQAVPGQETDPQHSAVRTLASRTIRLSLQSRRAAGQGSRPLATGMLPRMGLRWASCYSQEKPRVSRRRSHRRRRTRWRSRRS